MDTLFKCSTRIRYKTAYKFSEQVSEMLENSEPWDQIESVVEKLRRISFRLFMKANYRLLTRNRNMQKIETEELLGHEHHAVPGRAVK